MVILYLFDQLVKPIIYIKSKFEKSLHYGFLMIHKLFLEYKCVNYLILEYHDIIEYSFLLYTKLLSI